MKSLVNGFGSGFGRVFGRIVAYLVIGFGIYYLLKPKKKGKINNKYFNFFIEYHLLIY